MVNHPPSLPHHNGGYLCSMISVVNTNISRDKTSHYIYSRTSIIRTPVCHFNVEGVQISELSDKTH